MKKIILSVLTFTCISVMTIAQSSEFDRWSVSYAFGSHALTKPTSSAKANLRNLHIAHHDINGRFMFNNRFGAMADFGFDNMEFAGMKGKRTRYIRFSVQGVYNIGDVLKLNTLTPRLGMLFHAGAGLSDMWSQKPKKSGIKNFLGGHDKMMNLVFGYTPQFRIAPRWSVKADGSMIVNYGQNVTYDFKRKIKDLNKSSYIKSVGFFFDLSIGVTYHIGSNKNHLDWVPTFTSIGGGQTVRSAPRY